MLELIFPKRIIESQGVSENGDILSNRETQVLLAQPPMMVIPEKGFVVFDFGQEIYGRLHLITQSGPAGEIRIRLGESVAECYAELGEDNAGNYHSLRDCKLPIISYADLMTNDSGFRFARIDVVSGGPLQIRNVFAESKYFSTDNEGYFKSNDETVNKIFDVAKHTTSLCIQNGVVWDGAKRDRLVWIGDFHPEILSIASVYGCIEEIENVLDHGAVYMSNGVWTNCIPAYSAWWLICLNEYYRHYGKKEYVLRQIPVIKKVLAAFNEIVLEDGSISFKNSTLKYFEKNDFFFDWPTNFTEDSYYGWVSIIQYACQETQKLLAEFGENAEMADSLYERLRKNKTIASTFKQVEAWQYLSGRKTAADVKDALLNGGAKGMTGFMGYYILTAAVEAGGNAEVLTMIKDFYGAMLDCGATSFWEDFDVEWMEDQPQGLEEIPTKDRKNIHRDYGKYCYTGLRHSLCHGWTAGVLAFFTRTVLGVKPIAPGYSKVQIKPNLLGLTEVEGRIPTPHGDIYVKHMLQNGELVSDIQLPQGVEIDNNETNIY